MTSVLVVSRNAALGMWLGRNGLDVHEARLDQSESWTEEVAGRAAILLDVGNVDHARQRLRALVLAGLRVPVLLVGDGTEGWTALAERFSSGLSLLTLPLKPDDVLAELMSLAHGPRMDTVASHTPPTPSPTPSLEAASPPAQAVDEAPAGTTSETPLLDQVVTQLAVPDPTSVGSGGPSSLPTLPYVSYTPQLSPAPAEAAPLPPENPADPQPELVLEQSAPAELRDEAPAPAVAAEPMVASRAPEPRPPLGSTPRHSAGEVNLDATSESALPLIHELQGRVSSLNSVQEVADFALAEVVDRCGATAGAAMMRSDDSWVVEAGVGLRALESRLAVPAGHWLVDQVVNQELGLLVTRSDGSGHELSGVPLGSWAHVAAVFLPQSQLLLILASADVVFDDGHLALVRDFDDELKDPLLEAGAVRQLARSLLPFAADAGGDYST